ncbi:phosphoesterase RecJ domain protein, partial [mine drainage metagenome]
TINEIIKVFDSLNLRDAIIIVSDFSSNQANTAAMEKFVSKQKDVGNMVLWLDHHPWSDEAISTMSKGLDYGIAGENKLYCATEIIYKVLCETLDDDKTGKTIADHAHIADFNLALPPPADDTSPNISLAINYYTHINKGELSSGLRGIVEDVANCNYESPGIASATGRYRETARVEFERLKNNLTTLNTYGIKTVIGFGRFMHATSVCGTLHTLTGADLVLYVRTDENAVSARSWGDVDCSKIAIKMRGGGHPHAAAFRIDNFKGIDTIEGQQEFIKMISPMIELSVSHDSA